MRPGIKLLSVVAYLMAAAPVHARPLSLAGLWTWDKTQLLPPPNPSIFTHLLRQTWLVSCDDGLHYTAQRTETYDSGAVRSEIEDIAEDGLPHPVGTASDGGTLGVSVLPDGGRRLVSGSTRQIYDRQCRLSADGNTMTCQGTHFVMNGASGDYVSVFRRDRHVVIVQPDTTANSRQGH